MLSEDRFEALVRAAARAPSADNVQAWRFAPLEDGIAVDIEPSRMLPTDVGGMFGQIGLGAATESLALAAGRLGLSANVERGPVVRLSVGGSVDPLAAGLETRATNRSPYTAEPLGPGQLEALAESVRHSKHGCARSAQSFRSRSGGATGRGQSHVVSSGVGLHWCTGAEALDRAARLDARSTWIRLEHQPLKEELFEVLRFTRAEVEAARWGLDFASLGVPRGLGRLARALKVRWIYRLAVRLGLARLVSRSLATRLRQAGALCLITAPAPDAEGYVEAGRAMLRLWLAAEAQGLGVQPHGVLPQYLTKVAVEPASFLPAQVEVLQSVRADFDALFPTAAARPPAMLLRIGRPLGPPPPRSVRLPTDQMIQGMMKLTAPSSTARFGPKLF